MALVGTNSGCKVGWHYWDNEAEAIADAKQAAEQRDRMFAQGYDFGYQWPGSTPEKITHHEYGEVWRVVIP